MSTTTKRYLISSIVTFVSGFCIAILPFIETLQFADLGNGAILGLLFVGIRAGIKALLEWFLATFRV
jgi:hypothetical protein